MCDLVHVGAVLDISRLNVDFDVYGTPRASAYVFATYGTLAGFACALVVLFVYLLRPLLQGAAGGLGGSGG